MQIFALGILVVQIADREGAPELAPFYLGLAGLARAVPGLLLTLLAGAVADRVDRRRLLLITQSTMALNAAALAVLTFSGNAGSTYRIQRAAALQNSQTLWEDVGSATTDDVGHGEFTDTNPPSGQGYYRTVSH